MKILFVSVALLFSMKAVCQEGSSMLKFEDGNSAFIKLVSNYINSNISLDSSKNNLYSNLNITIDKNGKIKSISIFMMDDSSLSNIFYKAFMLTDWKWINSTGSVCSHCMIYQLPGFIRVGFFYGRTANQGSRHQESTGRFRSKYHLPAV
jgi:hypothetical protein